MMLGVVALALLVVYAATLKLNATVHFPVEYWQYDPVSHLEVIYNRTAKALAKQEAELGRPLKGHSNLSLERFLDMYLTSAKADYNSKKPDDWTISNILDNDYDLFPPNAEVFYKVRKLDENKEVTKGKGTEHQKKWTFKDFVEKYHPTAVWEQINEEAGGRNKTHTKKIISLVNKLDSTDELLTLDIPRSGRRWWNDQWQVPIGQNNTEVKTNDLRNILLFMKQAIYTARDKMTLMQKLRVEFRNTALYKMGYLFAKTDYSCKTFSSLSFKSFRSCSMLRQGVFWYYRLFHNFMDIAYNIERLEARWFDVDILKDLLITNDIIARRLILKDINITTPAMAVAAFNTMFID